MVKSPTPVSTAPITDRYRWQHAPLLVESSTNLTYLVRKRVDLDPLNEGWLWT